MALTAMTSPHHDANCKLDDAVKFVRPYLDEMPRIAIILGSGLGGIAERLERVNSVAYRKIPGFGNASAAGHRGQLMFGSLESTPVLAMAGRFHRYEGHSNDGVTFPVRVMAALGIKRLIITNAAGGVSPKLRVGDIVVIRDHINLMGGPLASVRSSHSFPVHDPTLYDPEMSATARRVGVEKDFTTVDGTYLATLGPTYETRSEIRMMRRIGVDVVGMSTIPEALAAADAKMRVLGLSLVSNVANPDRAVKADHGEVLEAGHAAEVKMEAIISEVARLS